MQSALSFGAAFPPAAPFFKIKGAPLAGARHTPDAVVTFILQWMPREIMVLNVSIDIFRRPLQKGVVAKDAGGIGFKPCLLSTHLTLVRSDAADPYIPLVQERLHWLNLVQLATGINVRGEKEISLLT